MIIVAHDRDLDGIGCHAILHRYCVKRDLYPDHIFVDYPYLREKLDNDRIKNARDEEIVIADIGYSDTTAESIPLVEHMGEKNKVRWIDHHDWSGAKTPKNVEMIIDMDKCASQLVAQKYLPDDVISSQISTWASAELRGKDMRKNEKLYWALSETIAAGFRKEKLTELLAEGNFWNDDLQKCYDKYQLKKERGFKYLDGHTIHYEIGGTTCVVGFSPSYLDSKLAAEHLLEKDTDLVICVWPNGKMSFRKNKSQLDLTKIASLFEGGGRETATGGKLGKNVIEDDFPTTSDKIIKKIKPLLK